LVSEQEILNEVKTQSPQDACVRLIEMAKERGGYDNITVMILPLSGILKENPSIKHRAFTKVEELELKPKVRRRLSPMAKVVISVMSFLVGVVLAILIAMTVGVVG
jgi:hypothetical protein